MIDLLEEFIGSCVPRETFLQLERYTTLLAEASQSQNLVSSSTLSELWPRHIFDSAQLMRHGRQGGSWVDVGSGAGLPGIILAILSHDPTTLIEPRRLRVGFLQAVIERLGLTNVTILPGKASVTTAKFETITARAVAPMSEFLALAHHLSRPDTVWVLPKGRSAQKELDETRRAWQGEFRLEPSLTDPQASILIARDVRRRDR
ncbi:MAG: 16S rRNA (guanine(527)-N(7))-methyltransferase RsmG [Sphingomicrobium sp.]